MNGNGIALSLCVLLNFPQAKLIDQMSHRKASKRRREAGGDDDFSPSVAPQKKRSKSHNIKAERCESPQNTSLDESESAVRRSSRTPKPKVFDDEGTFVIGRTPEASNPGDSGLIQPAESSLPETNLQRIAPVPNDEASISRKQRKSVGAAYNEGHKRETRRSYQDYLKELVKETDVVKQTSDGFYSVEQTTSKTGQSSRDKNIAKINSARRKSEVIAGNATPKGTSAMPKTPKEKGPLYVRIKREPPDEASPNVRSSSRTPVPKRVFSLLEGGGMVEIKSEMPSSPEVESEPVEFSSPKVRSSSRAHIPKKSFPLLEEDDAMKIQQATPEQTSSKARMPKLQVGKRQQSAAEEDSQQYLSRNTPIDSEEPSPKVRVSSRGHMPKRTFALLEGNETASEIQDESNVADKVWEDEKYLPGSSTEQGKGKDVNKEAKRRTSSNGKQLSSKQRSSKEEMTQAPNFDNNEPDGFPVSVKVEKLEMPRRNGKSGAVENGDAKTPSSSKLTPGRKHSTGTEADDCQGRPNKRKGKPVKRKVASSEQTHVTVADVKVKVEPEHISHCETTAIPKATKSKSSSRKKQVFESSGKQGPSGSRSAVAIKQESIGNQDSFSLSDLAKGVGDSLEKAGDVSYGTSKNNRKGKLSKNIEQKAADGKGKVLKKSKKDSRHLVTESTEQEHIILKLHLPQSEESKHKKHHHHHHHHHHHKHKHSSGDYEGSSPKKSQHKKTVSKLPKNVAESDRNQSTETKKKKKKISIKFKGLSSENIDLEMAADSPRVVQRVECDAKVNDDAKSTQPSKGNNEEESTKKSKESFKKKKKSKAAADLSSSQSDGERVKLVIRKDKLPSSSKSGEKKSLQPTTSQAKAGDQKKATAPSTSSKKEKGGTTPAKTSKSPSVCLKCKVLFQYQKFSDKLCDCALYSERQIVR